MRRLLVQILFLSAAIPLVIGCCWPGERVSGLVRVGVPIAHQGGLSGHALGLGPWRILQGDGDTDCLAIHQCLSGIITGHSSSLGGGECRQPVTGLAASVAEPDLEARGGVSVADTGGESIAPPARLHLLRRVLLI